MILPVKMALTVVHQRRVPSSSLFLFLLVLLCHLFCFSQSLKVNRVIKPRRLLPVRDGSPSDGVAGKGFGSGTSIPKPNIITPTEAGSSKGIEKFLMMYTCKICNGRNAHMISKIAYNYGMVVCTCKTCRNRHLIADNEGKLDFKEYGKKIEEYLVQQGETVQRLSIPANDLKDYYILDQDGKVTLVPKTMGQPSPNANIVEIPEENASKAAGVKFKGFAPGLFDMDEDGIPTIDLGGGGKGGGGGDGGKGGVGGDGGGNQGSTDGGDQTYKALGPGNN